MALLEIAGLRGGYGQVAVLHDVHLEVNEGAVTVLLGANGAGKTTTLRAISGMIKPLGQLLFKGKPIGGMRPEVIAAAGIAHVPQGRGTFSDLTVEENLRIGGYVLKRRELRAQMQQWFAIFPRLEERRTQRAGNLSGGEQQMLAIARALMSRPSLLLLDEPSLGLAPVITQDLFRRLAEINHSEGTTMLVVEQNASLALHMAAKAFVLETGRIVSSGTPDELTRDDAVRRAYLGY